MNEAWNRMPKDITKGRKYTGTIGQREEIKNRAVDREYPFQRSKNEKPR